MCIDRQSESFESAVSATTLQLAFKSCNPELLLDVLLDSEAGWGVSYRNIGFNAKESLLEKLVSTIALMGSIGEKGSRHIEDFEKLTFGFHSSDESVFLDAEDDSARKIIVPSETFEVSEDGRSFMRRLDARFLDCSKLKDAMELIQKIGGKIRPDLEADADFTFNGHSDPFELVLATGLLEEIDVLEDEPWSVALQRKIWLPYTYCERERYSVLANVFWAMTYRGFFGVAVEKILDMHPVSPVECGLLESFDEDYEKRLSKIAALLNYNGWVDSIEYLLQLCKAA